MERAKTTLSSIPQELIEENILSRLPVKSISRFRCVCKYWCNNLFKSPRFIKSHLQHAIVMNKFNLLVSQQKIFFHNPREPALYSVDHNVLLSSLSISSQLKGDIMEIDHPYRSERSWTQFHGSCNGLVCITLYGIGIWNPSTKEYKRVPKTPVEFPSFEAKWNQSYSCAYGFGYDCKIDDYKLLRIVNFYKEKGRDTVNYTLGSEEVSEARIYTLGTNSWRGLGFIARVYSKGIRGILVDCALHWLAYTYHTETGIETKRVASFDICDETFRNTSLPDDRFTNGISDLCMWEGKLCLVFMKVEEIAFTVWTMKDYTWSKHFNIAEPIFHNRISRSPIQVFQNGKILFKSYISEEQKFGLISYDPKLESGRVLNIRGLADLRDIEPYIGTLVSVNSGTFVGKNK